MPVDEGIKRRIIELYFNERRTIREITRITKKSSRDVIAVLRNTAYEGKGKEEENEKTCGNDTRKLIQEKEDTAQEYNHLPLNTFSRNIIVLNAQSISNKGL